MTIDLDASLNAIGYAKVIVALKPQMALARTAAAEAELDMHFVLPDETQVARLAAVAERAASKKFRRAQALTRRKVRVYPHLGLALGTSTGRARHPWRRTIEWMPWRLPPRCVSSGRSR
jgi:subtilisin